MNLQPPDAALRPALRAAAARRELGRRLRNERDPKTRALAREALAAPCSHGTPKFKCWEHGHMAADEPDDDYRTTDGQLKDWVKRGD